MKTYLVCALLAITVVSSCSSLDNKSTFTKRGLASYNRDAAYLQHVKLTSNLPVKGLNPRICLDNICQGDAFHIKFSGYEQKYDYVRNLSIWNGEVSINGQTEITWDGMSFARHNNYGNILDENRLKALRISIV